MFRFNFLKCFCVIAMFVMMFVVWDGEASAAESGPINFPAGSSGIMIGQAPPFPGVFLELKTSYTGSDALYDNNADEINYLDWKLKAFTETFRIIPRYKNKILGADAFSQVIIPLVHLDGSLSAYGHEVYDETETGLGNITISPLVLDWNKGTNHFVTGLDIATEIGSYDKNNNLNPATGYTSIIPVVAFRHNDPQGLDFGLKVAPLFNLENRHTDYKTGTILTVENVTGWNFGKLKVGVVGGYTQQLTDDEQDGSKIRDNRMKKLNIGPSVSYMFKSFVLEVNFQKGLIAENTTKDDMVYVNISMPLTMPPMMKKH